MRNYDHTWDLSHPHCMSHSRNQFFVFRFCSNVHERELKEIANEEKKQQMHKQTKESKDFDQKSEDTKSVAVGLGKTQSRWIDKQ